MKNYQNTRSRYYFQNTRKHESIVDYWYLSSFAASPNPIGNTGIEGKYDISAIGLRYIPSITN